MRFNLNVKRATRIRPFYVLTILYMVIIECHLQSNQNEYMKYIISVGYFFLFILFYLSRIKKNLSRKSILRQVVLIMLLVYSYGLLVGIINLNPMQNIVRNFAGMLMYIISLPILYSNIKEKTITKILLYISMCTPVITILLWVNINVVRYADLTNLPILNNFRGNVLYATRETIYISYAYCLYIILNQENRKKLWHFLIVALDLVAVLVCENSDGDKLGIIVITTIIIIVFTLKTKNYNALIVFILGVLSLGIYYVSGHSSIIMEIFSSDDGGNFRRNQQIAYFFNGNLSFLGKGLGAPLGLMGASEYNYGNEVIFLNIFHKFGVFATLILYAYIITVKNAIKILHRSKDNPNDVIPLACMGYLFPSLGNPMLFSVDLVLLHIIALWIIDNRRDDYYRLKLARGKRLME